MDTEPKLSANTRSYVGTSPFEGDTFDRKQLADKLTNYLSRLNDGAVLAIDAQWGEGKTWFGKNWNQSMLNQGYTTIYIDAFEQDYIEDPFMLLTSEVIAIIDKSNPIAKALKTCSIEVTKALLPVITKTLFNLGGRILLGSSNVAQEFQEAIDAGQNVASDLTNKWISEKIDSFTTDKIVMDEFKKKVAEYAHSLEKPLVIFVDELDRCKPTFAIELIERIKHFFDVPNIIFVLLLNREQLEKAVKGIYGAETDASLYLDKFINFYFRLPKHNKLSHKSKQNIENFISSIFLKYKFPKTSNNSVFMGQLFNLSIYFDLSLRDIEKCIALFAFAFPRDNRIATILTYLIILKIKNRNLFNRLVTNNIDAHREAKNLIEKFIIAAPSFNDDKFAKNVLTCYLEWHTAHITNFNTIGENFQKHIINPLYPMDEKNCFYELSKLIDIDIEQ